MSDGPNGGRMMMNWPKPGDLTEVMPSNPCGNFDCDDVPSEPGPCAEFVRCECGWPAAAGVHCNTCQHAEACHERFRENI